ncbi:MAG: hypothetical protein Kow0090_01120 [Myxococcota bacterium]
MDARKISEMKFFRLFLLVSLLAYVSTAGAIERKEALQRAGEFANHEWSCTKANTTADCSASYKSDYCPGTYIGLPYDWGGYKTIPEFDADIAAGQGAGSHSWHGVLECTTGHDCSGFVTQCWRAPHNSTSSMYTITTEIELSEVLPADAFNKAGSHIVLFAFYREDGVPVFYEAAGDANKVWLNSTASWNYLKGYKTIRYTNIEGEAPDLGDDDDTASGPAGTEDDPIPIEKFPFVDDRNTRKAKSREFDEYNCKPGTYEWGAEFIYFFDLKEEGTISISITDGPDTDVDIHILSSLSEDACLARDDKHIEAFLSAGRYYIVIDTWTDNSGKEYPGSYHLEAYFEPGGAGESDAGDLPTDDIYEEKTPTADSDAGDDDDEEGEGDNLDFIDELFAEEGCECNVRRISATWLDTIAQLLSWQ